MVTPIITRETAMTKKRGREAARRDIWLTDEDMQHIEIIASEMQRLGLDPNNQYGRLSISQVIQWALEQQTSIIGGDS